MCILCPSPFGINELFVMSNTILTATKTLVKGNPGAVEDVGKGFTGLVLMRSICFVMA